MMPGTRVVTLRIDDRDLGAREDQTILEVAREHHIEIPTLCHLQGLSTSAPAACASSRSRGNRACRLRASPGSPRAWRS
jgi:predicted molibdopterin-dependent oxidoreductase YjgC